MRVALGEGSFKKFNDKNMRKENFLSSYIYLSCPKIKMIIIIIHFLIGRITLRNGISLGDRITDVKLVKNAIITHIYTAKGVKR